MQSTEQICGWILSGTSAALSIATSNAPINVLGLVSKVDLDSTSWEFSDLKELTTERQLTPNEEYCGRLYKKTRTRDTSDRFTDLRITYAACLTEFLELDHMKAISFDHRNKPKCLETVPTTYYYLGHHAVIKESSSSTRVRVVFDGSGGTSTGFSSNDCILTEPRL